MIAKVAFTGIVLVVSALTTCQQMEQAGGVKVRTDSPSKKPPPAAYKFRKDEETVFAFEAMVQIDFDENENPVRMRIKNTDPKYKNDPVEIIKLTMKAYSDNFFEGEVIYNKRLSANNVISQQFEIKLSQDYWISMKNEIKGGKSEIFHNVSSEGEIYSARYLTDAEKQELADAIPTPIPTPIPAPIPAPMIPDDPTSGRSIEEMKADMQSVCPLIEFGRYRGFFGASFHGFPNEKLGWFATTFKSTYSGKDCEYRFHGLTDKMVTDFMKEKKVFCKLNGKNLLAVGDVVIEYSACKKEQNVGLYVGEDGKLHIAMEDGYDPGGNSGRRTAIGSNGQQIGSWEYYEVPD